MKSILWPLIRMIQVGGRNFFFSAKVLYQRGNTSTLILTLLLWITLIAFLIMYPSGLPVTLLDLTPVSSQERNTTVPSSSSTTEQPMESTSIINQINPIGSAAAVQSLPSSETKTLSAATSTTIQIIVTPSPTSGLGLSKKVLSVEKLQETARECSEIRFHSEARFACFMALLTPTK